MERTRHKSPGVAVAIAVALLALVVSLSSGVYAAAKINGKDIEKGSIAGNRIKKDGITGKQVKESSLGTVPRASTLAGVGPGGFVSSGDRRRVKFAETRTTSDVAKPLLSLGTLRLTARCDANSLDIIGSTTSSGGSVDLSSVFSGTAITTQPFVSGGGLSSSPDTILGTSAVDAGEYYREVGSIVYNSDPAREAIRISFAMYVSREASSTFCYLAGTAERVAG